MYKLKPTSPDFVCCDGPFAGRKFIAGDIYDEIPPAEADKFETVTEPAVSEANEPKSKASRRPEVTDA